MPLLRSSHNKTPTIHFPTYKLPRRQSLFLVVNSFFVKFVHRILKDIHFIRRRKAISLQSASTMHIGDYRWLCRSIDAEMMTEKIEKKHNTNDNGKGARLRERQ